MLLNREHPLWMFQVMRAEVVKVTKFDKIYFCTQESLKALLIQFVCVCVCVCGVCVRVYVCVFGTLVERKAIYSVCDVQISELYTTYCTCYTLKSVDSVLKNGQF